MESRTYTAAEVEALLQQRLEAHIEIADELRQEHAALRKALASIADSHPWSGRAPLAQIAKGALSKVDNAADELEKAVAEAREASLLEAMDALEKKRTTYVRMSRAVGDKPHNAASVMSTARAIVQDLLQSSGGPANV